MGRVNQLILSLSLTHMSVSYDVDTDYERDHFTYIDDGMYLGETNQVTGKRRMNEIK